jgi:iron complex transport system ATP-binding protein
MSHDNEVIALESVSVVRNGRHLLRGVDWTVEAHERWVILGPNGAGKTTMLQVASMYLAPTSGTVRLLGKARGAFDVRELRTRVGYSGAGPAALVRATLPAVDIVITGKHASFVDTRWHSYEDADWERARENLARLEAGHLADRMFSTLSAGEKQRVLIARSLMTRPELLLLDEAATGLDLGAREHLVAALGAMASDASSPSCVLVTHHVEEIPNGFSHVAIVSDGAVGDSGPLDGTLTAAALSHAFGLDLRLRTDDGRFHAWSP